jgi:hypothetical protein
MLDAGWQEIDRKLRGVARRRAALEAEEAPLLLAALRAEVHKHLGYGTFLEYLERTCGYAPTTARDRIRVAEALETLPATREALAAGHVSYSAVRELTHVLDPDTEEQWLAALEGCTVREVEDALRGRAPGDLPEDRPDPALEPRVLRLKLPPEVYALFAEARRRMEAEVGHPLTDAELMAELCRESIDRTSGDHSGDSQTRHQISVSVCPDCQRGWQDTGSRSVEVPPAAIERMRCDAFELGRVDGAAPEERTRTIPASVRRAVLARDHHRCTVPGCRSSRFLEVHHIHPWSEGGAHELFNLTTLCGLHHDMHHDGRITINGAPGALVVAHADGRPYGQAPPGTHVGGPPVELIADAKLTLTTLGFHRAEAASAVERALTHVGEGATLEVLVRESLRACPRSTASRS